MTNEIGKSTGILLIEGSARQSDSVSRALGSEIVDQLMRKFPGADLKTRDVSSGLPFVDAEWVAANFTAPAERTDDHRRKLTLSDKLVDELSAADIIVIATPIYNFGIPATVKAWIDLIARAGRTFRYGENGPIGLLGGKKAYVALASGGTQVGSGIDFASGYLEHIMSFIGISDVEIIAADQIVKDGESVSRAKAQIEAII